LPRKTAGLLAAVATALALGACLPTPVLHAPEVGGRVVDAETGKPLAGAIVVVRYDARYEDLLPDRDLVGLAEVASDADGTFRAGPVWRFGLSLWPLVRTEARVIGVMHDGYRCPSPVAIPAAGQAQVVLEPAFDATDRQASCRPLSAGPTEAPRYLAAWRSLHPGVLSEQDKERDRELSRVLAAREVFGFGENCEGPVSDLALAPDGRRLAYLAHDAAESQVGILEVEGDARPLASVPAGSASRSDASSTRRLAWAGPDELVVWEPANRLDRAFSVSMVSMAGAPPEVIWRAESTGDAPGTALAPGPSRRPQAVEEGNVAGEALWNGRSFTLVRGLDPETGLAMDRMRVIDLDGTRREIPLPGETCGPRGQFGRPQQRIGDGGRTAFDLRHVQGGCHVVGIDLSTGAWRVVDAAGAPTACREVRSVPASQIDLARRGYALEIEEALEAAGADPAAAYSVRIEPGGDTRVVSRDFGGEIRVAPLPAFPIATPLLRIDVAVLGSARTTGPKAAPVPEPL
jgi:hypothetical protein